MNTGRIIRTIILTLALFMGAASETWALSDTDIIIDPASPEGGSVVVKSVVGQTVTITVTPAEGYLISKSDIIVQKLQNLNQAQSRRRAPAIADRLDVTGSDETDAAADYTFEVPTGYAGALVTVTFTVKPTNAYTIHIIDMSGHIIVEQSGDFDALEVPAKWQSPLVQTYHFYKESDFNVIDGVYTLRTGASEISNFDSAPKDIYVKYDPSSTYDLDGSEQRAVDGKKYLLKFAGGTSFRQESGDGFETTAKPGIYPYINGEGGLFVYGQDKLDATADAVASTRTRWAWYLEGGDPYRLRIASLQTRTDGTTDDTHYSYLRTYKPQGYNQVVTGVISNNPSVYDASDDAHAVRHKPTDYMILKGTGTHFRLVTSDVVDDLDGNAANDVRHTVTSFENYWKTNPTAANVIHAKYNAYTIGTTPTDGQIEGALTTGEGAIGWHTYNVWANGSTWTNSKKAFGYGPHWFQTIGVGTKVGSDYNGDFDLVEYDLDGALILLDQHGWEVMRKPITNRSSDKEAYDAAIKKYNSPMVKMYHFWTNFVKESGYQKYKPIRGNATASKNAQHQKESTSLADYPEVASTGTLADIYVTYEVMGTYRGRYTGADTQAGTDASNSKYLIRQGTNYAKTTDGSTITTEPVANVSDVSTVTNESGLLWYVKPNFNIDTEMGYNYSGSYEEKTKDETEAAYFANRDDAVYDKTNGQNGFDPYNLQIVSVNTGKLFKTTADDAVLDGSGGMRSTYTGAKTVTLGDYGEAFVASDYYNMDKTTGTGYQMLHVTNSTFMAVSDDNGNIRLMPRFDHHNVATSISTLDAQQPTAPLSDDEGTQTTLFVLPKASSSGGLVYCSDEITNMYGNYILSEGFDVTKVIGTAGDPFKGTIDGQLKTIYGVGHSLVGYADGAVIKNVILDNVSISVGTNVGAICNEATGSTRIYNCGILSGSVGGGAKVGGLVGLLDGSSRVINCFSYANINSGTDKGGIVGYNNKASTQSSLTTMVMNCMFYGNIADGNNISPVYGGTEINNVAGGMNNYNYYRYRSPYSVDKKITKYNRALAMEEKFINRFERYRLLLNSNKKLAAKYASTSDVTVNPDDMAKWVLETADRTIDNPYPYPVLKQQGKYPSIINYDAKNAPDSTLVGRLKGGKLGRILAVTIKTKSEKTDGGQSWPTATTSDVQTTSLNLIRTDKDEVRFNFNYDKVQLPYYNDVGTGNYTENRVVTGWKITDITGGTAGTYNPEDEWGGYNFADRNCTNKDKYSVSGRVFSQGAYWDVPNGVTAITIEPYWAIANYVSDDTYDVVYNKDYAIQTFTPFGTQYSNNSTIDIYNDGSTDQKVYNTISAALAGFNNTNKTVYDQAVVLVGNVHQYANPTNVDTPYTVMSIDMNHDNEPDYSYIFTHDNRRPISPIRYDFINIMGVAEAQIPNGATLLRNVSIFNLKGWFEITNTCVVNFSQFEYDNNKDSQNGVTKSSAPLILLGGTFEQLVSTQKSECSTGTKYIHVGSNAWFAKFGTGTHSDGSKFTPHVPISVTGGDYDEFYLSGTYQPTISNMQSDNAECYISGGHFGEMAGASLEAIQGDVRWDINWADITNFYGGGVNAVNPITGDIRVDMTNSHVHLYCGGPKFGDMTEEKKVTTNATDCHFDTFFGAGYGGNAYNRVKYKDEQNVEPNSQQSNYTSERGKYYDGTSSSTSYGKKGKGVATDFDYEFFVWSTGGTGSRFYVKFITFSLATTHSVTSKLTKCKVTGNVYGGGSLGKVSGDVNTMLTNCDVNGNVFGAGYSATLPKIDVRTAPAFIEGKEPKKNMNIGMFEPGEANTTEEYEWKQLTTMPGNGQAGMISNDDGNYVYTNENLNKSNLGSVAGNVTLTIKGDSKIGTDGDATKGHVFGGGEESYVTKSKDSNNQPIANTGNTTVYIEGNTQVYGNVFGGGDRGVVEGSTEVNIRETPSENP
ncbi:MAG: hypothetical protein J6Z14_14650 [Prevotella sp.]|nr:hypothetical protein [Prevotella sp.]